MELSNSMNLAQKQVLAISSEMRIALDILALPAMELNSYINSLAASNPVLEVEAMPYETENAYVADCKPGFLDYLDDSNINDYFEAEWDSQQDSITRVTRNETNLKNYLLEQAVTIRLKKTEDYILKYLIEQLDENGYLKSSLKAIAENCFVPEHTVKRMLRLLQTFEPFGVGARCLKECLIIQLNRTGKNNCLIEKVVKENLVDIANNSIEKICLKQKISLKDAIEAVKTIKSLEPKPGRSFQIADEPIYIIPEITILKNESGFDIIYNDKIFPVLGISNYYKTLLSTHNDPSLRKYIQNKLENCLWISKCIEHRKQTVFQIVQCILKYQSVFFKNGSSYLRYLTQQQIADELGIHPSTVSRAIKDKYIQTPWGAFKLSAFFISGNYFKNRVNITDCSITAMIKKIIAEENREKPLSDQRICDILKKSDIEIARRTIAKYREELNIPNASKRKEFII